MRGRAAFVLWCALAAAPACEASALRFCDRQVPLSAGQQDKLLRFGSIIKNELEQSGQSLALVARSGLDLSRFGTRYSHAGISLKASQNTPWSVRQLYYACDEQKPRIYDQGMSGFVLGTDDAASGYVSVVFVPPQQAAELERAALDNRRALRLLSASYSANAYPFSLRYQNCNQWVAEMLASAWGGLGDGDDLRERTQRWLKDQDFRPTVFDVARPLAVLSAFVPWIHADDHPSEDLERLVYRVSMPAAIEGFVQRRLPEARRVEFCHTEQHVVIRRGWEPIADGCRPAEGDTVIAWE